jgi:hypothetical protein
VAWPLMRSASGRPRRLPGKRQQGRIETPATDYLRAAHDLGRLRMLRCRRVIGDALVRNDRPAARAVPGRSAPGIDVEAAGGPCPGRGRPGSVYQGHCASL